MDISIYPKKELLAKWSEDRKWYEAAAGKPPRCLTWKPALFLQ